MMKVFRRIREWFAGWSIVTKVALVYSAIVLIPIAAFVAVSSSQIAQSEQKELELFYLQALRGEIQRLETELATAERATDLIALNYDVLDLLAKEIELADIIPYRENILKPMRSLVNLTTGELASMSIYVENETMPEAWSYVYRSDKFSGPVSLEEAYDLGISGSWFYEIQNAELLYIYLRPLIQYDGVNLGVISCTVKGRSIVSDVVPLVAKDDFFFLLGTDGELVLSQNTAGKSPKMDSHIRSKLNAAGKSGTIRSKKGLYIYDTIPALNLKIGALVADKRLSKEINQNSIVLFWVVGLGIVFMWILSLFISRKIFGPFRSFVEVMNRVARGQLDERIRVSGGREITDLAQDFNLMIERINTLVDQVITRERSQKDARLMALQYRVNPHMIFNTLEVFGGRMELNGDYEGAEAVSNFGELLRYNMAEDYLTALISDELEHVKNYITIENIRFRNGIRFNSAVDRGLENRKIIKFLLQPLVENSIRHGLGEQKTIDIYISIEDLHDDIRITVTDFGNGIEKERLNRIHTMLDQIELEADKPHKERAIGLRNIAERIYIMYGKEYGVEVSSSPGEFTRVSIRIPKTEG